MNILDIIILITLVPSVIIGIKKGFVSQAVGLLTIFVGLWVSSLFATQVCAWLSEIVTANQHILKFASLAIIFTIIFLLLSIVGRFIERSLDIICLGWVNHILGSVLAIVKYALIAGVILIAFDFINVTYGLLPETNVIDDSVLCKVIKQIADTVFPYVTKLLHI